MTKIRFLIPSEILLQKLDLPSFTSILLINYKYYFLSFGLKKVSISFVFFFLSDFSRPYTHSKKFIRQIPDTKTFELSCFFPFSIYSGDWEQRLLISSHQSMSLPRQRKILPSYELILIILHKINFISDSERGLKSDKGVHAVHLAMV